MTRDIWILLAGEYSAPAVLPKAGGMIIAADAGIAHAEKLGRAPDIWLGDFDSTADEPQQYPNAARRRYPADKDKTDFALALDCAQQYLQPDSTLHIIGSAGGEADHAFGNLWVLPAYAGRIVLWQPDAVLICAKGPVNVQWTAPAGGQAAKISLFALTSLTGLASSGLQWPAPAALVPFDSLASRNAMTGRRAGYGWQTGCGLLFLPKNTVPEFQPA